MTESRDSIQLDLLGVYPVVYPEDEVSTLARENGMCVADYEEAISTAVIIEVSLRANVFEPVSLDIWDLCVKSGVGDENFDIPWLMVELDADGSRVVRNFELKSSFTFNISCRLAFFIHGWWRSPTLWFLGKPYKSPVAFSTSPRLTSLMKYYPWW